MGIVLYLDKSNEYLEQVMIDHCPEDLELRFLQPAIGKQGALAEADYAISSIDPDVDRVLIDKMPNLKMIQRTGVGYDNVDIRYAKEKNIPVCIAANTLNDSVAELVVLDILAVYRNLFQLHKDTQEGLWNKWKYRQVSYEIKGKTIGVIGTGRIGRTVIRKLKGFDPAKFLYYDLFRMTEHEEKELSAQYCELNELLKNADIVTLHLPYLPETANLINKEYLSLLKPNAVFINTSRGGIVDNIALAKLLKDKKIQGAGIDVYGIEPIQKDDPFLGLDNVITTPHVASCTIDCFHKVCELIMANILSFQRGNTPKYIVNM